MASSKTRNDLRTRIFARSYDHDPGASTAKLAGPDGGTTIRHVDMSQFRNLLVIAMSTALTGAGVNLLEIVADETAAFSDPVVVKTSGAVVCDAMGDQAVLECSAEELAALGAANSKDLRYAAARVTMANAADEGVVTYIAEARWPHDALTANYIS